MNGDNFNFTVEGGMECLPHAVALAYTEVGNPTGEYGVNGWYEAPADKGQDVLILTRLKGAGQRLVSPNKLPHVLSEEQAISMITSWLESQDYGKQPNHDGSNGKGFKAWSPEHWADVIVVQPRWSMYGK